MAYSSSSDKGSLAVMAWRKGDCIHSWYVATYWRRYGTSTTLLPTWCG